MKRLGFMMAFLVITHVSHAQANCPWLNAATAGGFLGGEVETTVSAPIPPVSDKGVGQANYPDQVRMDRFDTTCEFRRRSESDSARLRIEVNTSADPMHTYAGFVAKCSTTTPLRGIGNEAVQCVGKAGQEEVIGRVRERIFVMTVVRAATPGNSGDLRDDTRNIAEQVAGSLF